MNAPVADETLDCKGLLCPVPIVRLSKTIKALDSGKVLLLEATDPGSVPDVQAWQRRTQNELVHHSEDGGVFKFWIKKTT
ncbi:MAG: sulfurtransferase TusA family protein [Gemmatimonadota bacterium]|nr:sulfurtransferase TusA family protein [Gemmatimonadota bacterium]